MKKPLIVANWKMNPVSLVEAKRNFEIIKRGVRNIKNVETVVCAPFVFLPALKAAKNLKLGAQNCFFKNKGPFTGEVSPAQIKSLGCQYVILGHSERRKYFKENTEIVNRKIKAALEVGLRVIFCVGSESKKPGKEIKYQLGKGLQGFDKSIFNSLVLVYEPVWAISTTKNKATATPKEALSGFLYMKKVLEKLFDKKTAREAKIIYGGSVDSKNVKGFLGEGLMSGGLVGAASLNPKEFIRTVIEAGKS
jgi:triosephosphate isomerase